jgi:hypothetical protein
MSAASLISELDKINNRVYNYELSNYKLRFTNLFLAEEFQVSQTNTKLRQQSHPEPGLSKPSSQAH